MNTNLEYIGWMEEILGLDYSLFQVVLLYCNWIQVNMAGARATMRRDEYGFTQVKFSRLIPFFADSFAFPLHVQQVFFVGNVDDTEWKIVLRKASRGTRVASDEEDREELQCLQVRAVSEHTGLKVDGAEVDAMPMEWNMEECRTLSNDAVRCELATVEVDVESEEDTQSENVVTAQRTTATI
jgi:hypothetical protein